MKELLFVAVASLLNLGTLAASTDEFQDFSLNDADEQEIYAEPLPYSEYDEQIVEVFNADTFTKRTVDYIWERKKYPVHIIYNPERSYLWSEELSHPVVWPFVITIDDATYPFSLTDHLKTLIPDALLFDHESLIDLADSNAYFSNYDFDTLATLHPVTVSKSIENPPIDEQIRTLFSSSKLVKRNLHYLIDDCWYKVLLIHNPEGKMLTSSISFSTREFGLLKRTVTWNWKIGIYVDRKGPKALIDHLYNLASPSWMDTLWYGVEYNNGGIVQATIDNGTFIYYYKVAPLYTFMMRAKEKK